MSILNASAAPLYALLVSLASCGYHQIKNEAPATNEVSAGNKFCINLPENHTTGYMWQLNNDYDQTIVEALNAVWHGNEKGIDFNFKALNPGVVRFTLVQRKYTDTLNVKSFIVKIKE